MVASEAVMEARKNSPICKRMMDVSSIINLREEINWVSICNVLEFSELRQFHHVETSTELERENRDNIWLFWSEINIINAISSFSPNLAQYQWSSACIL